MVAYDRACPIGVIADVIGSEAFGCADEADKPLFSSIILSCAFVSLGPSLDVVLC